MFSSNPIIFAMILSVRPRSALIEKLVTIPKLFYPTRSSSASISSSCCGGVGGGWFTTDLRDISHGSCNMPGPWLLQPASDVPGVQH